MEDLVGEAVKYLIAVFLSVIIYFLKSLHKTIMKFMEDSIVNFKGFHEEMAKFRSDIRLILQENNYIKERIDSNEKRIDKNEGEILNLRDFKHKHERDYENIVKLLRNDLE